MQATIRTMAFNGIDTIPVDVQVHLSNGMPGFAIVGLADQAVGLDGDALALLHQAGEKQALSARGLHRVLRVARTIADLDGDDQTRSTHLAEALRYRRFPSES